MKKSRINREMRWGGGILSVYLLWDILWLLYKFFIVGSLANPYQPQSDIVNELVAPFANGFFMGTDIYGQSLIEILSSGLNYSLAMSLVVSLSAATIGIVLGYISVRAPHYVKITSDLFINLIFIFPSILIAIMVMSVTGQSLWGLAFALIITGWPGYAKIMRGETMRVMGLTYVESAKAIGIGELRLFITIVLPSVFPLLLIHIVLGMSGVIISEATLGFLGLGGSEYSWGALLSMGKSVLLEAPYIVIVLSLAMSGLIIGLNLFGDGLRDFLDPQTKNL